MTRAVSPAALRELLFATAELALPDVRTRQEFEQVRAYLGWEVALVEQIKRDPSIRFRAYD